MKTCTQKTWSAAELAERWNLHPCSIARMMRRYGIAGLKFGTTRQATRRFTTHQVETIEKLAGFDSSTGNSLRME